MSRARTSRPRTTQDSPDATGSPDATTTPVGRRSLRATMVVLLAATVALLCLGVGVVTHVSVSGHLRDQLDEQLGRAADRRMPPTNGDSGGVDLSDVDPGTVPDLSGAPAGPGAGEFELGALMLATDGSLQGSWRDAQGAIHELGTEDQEALAAAATDAVTSGNRDVSLTIGDYRVHADETGGVVVITGLPLATTTSTITRLDLTLLLAGVLATLVAGVAGSLIVRRALGPLEEVTAVARHIADMPLTGGDVALTARVRPEIARAGTEPGEVGRALNLLIDNVDEALEVRALSETRMRRFVADASHELRTPLTAIRGYAEMLRYTEELTPRGEQSVERMEAQAERMTALVEDMLLLARLDEEALAAAGVHGAMRTGATSGHDEVVELGEIVVDAVMDARVTAPGHSWRLEVGADEVPVRGDARQLTQVVVNLLANARKHTPDGTEVRVRLGTEQGTVEGAEKGAVTSTAVLEVIDDGPGIDPAIADHVFARFARADSARSGSDGTTGLGLSIVQAITEAHHGRIEVDSRPGRTAFTVRLPLAS